ncbi:MAG: hypothetical protein LIO91_03480 [Bacteroidales bacterium]|nr:hypothetical protein [Bacteroidales bacterium]
MKPTNTTSSKGTRLALLDIARKIANAIERYFDWCMRADRADNPAKI